MGPKAIDIRNFDVMASGRACHARGYLPQEQPSARSIEQTNQ
jgi:hypothetical protein